MDRLLEFNLVSFSVSPMKSTQVFWVAPEVADDTEEFLKKYAVGIPHNACFKSLTFDTCAIAVHAERYGGAGTGANGGGARCANIYDAQVKGIDANCLVGHNVKKRHSHGAQNITEAIFEVIYSDALARILPSGVVKCGGIISTGKNAAFFTDDIEAEELKTCWGALLVRDTCVRPAHFLRSRTYVTPKRMLNDVARMRAVHKTLASEHVNHNEFIRTLGKFLANCASQFAFAQVARIAHMATSPSNITLGGAWLDLASVSFLDSGKNYAADSIQRPFLKEYTLIEETIVELVATYAKFNEVTLNVAPLLSYFNEAMNDYFHEHCSYLFGLSKEWWPKMGELKECDSLVQMIHQIIHQDESIVIGLPFSQNPDDPVIKFIECLFISLANRERAKQLFALHLTRRIQLRSA